ncbi:MAG TPA: SDR family oxidoreductase [Nitrospirota bacterium]|nr:SDR family oxidoreductase [Nitrospirota bacterium]
MIAVTGATGQLGRLVIAALLKRTQAAEIVAVVRNAEKAKDLAAAGAAVRVADYNRPQDWDAALKGAEKVLLISSSEVGQRAKQHRSVIDAAKRAGVKLLAYTSILRADRSPLGIAAEHRETEAMIRAAGIPAAFLRNSWYTENYTAGIPGILERGAVYGCAGHGRISSAARADYAEAAAMVMTAENQAGTIHELAGDGSFSLAEFAAEISRQAGKNIGYINIPEADFRNALLKAGLPEPIAALLADSETGISGGGLFDDSRELSALIKRPTTPWTASVAAVLGSKS